MAGRRYLVELILPLAYVHLGRLPGDLEMVVAHFQGIPELEVRIVLVARHVLRRHAERVGLVLERGLAAGKGIPRESVDLLDLLVRHGEAAGCRTTAMDNRVLAGAAVCASVGVRDSDVE